jgi:hypothetical protein
MDLEARLQGLEHGDSVTVQIVAANGGAGDGWVIVRSGQSVATLPVVYVGYYLARFVDALTRLHMLLAGEAILTNWDETVHLSVRAENGKLIASGTFRHLRHVEPVPVEVRVQLANMEVEQTYLLRFVQDLRNVLRATGIGTEDPWKP